jgi:hypothetical protein
MRPKIPSKGLRGKCVLYISVIYIYKIVHTVYDQRQDSFIPAHLWSKLVLVTFHVYPLSKAKEAFL